MWAPAQIGKLALVVKGDAAVFQVLQQFQLVLITFFPKVFDGGLLAYLFPLEFIFLPGQLQHFFFYPGNVFQGIKRCISKIHIVIKPRVYGGPDAEFYTGKQGLQGFSHQVRRGVPEGSFSIFIVPGEQLKRSITFNRPGGIPHFTIYLCCQYISRKPFAY